MPGETTDALSTPFVSDRAETGSSGRIPAVLASLTGAIGVSFAILGGLSGLLETLSEVEFSVQQQAVQTVSLDTGAMKKEHLGPGGRPHKMRVLRSYYDPVSRPPLRTVCIHDVFTLPSFEYDDVLLPERDVIFPKPFRTSADSPFVRKLRDRDPQPLVRIPPRVPREATRSGWCDVVLDVSELGRVANPRVTLCSQGVFHDPSLRAVKRWRYQPKIHDGRAVPRYGVEARVRFRVLDEDGNIIPE